MHMPILSRPQWWQRRASSVRHQKRVVSRNGASSPNPTLIHIPPGGSAKILGFSPKISPQRLAHLQAYGLVPGHWVQIVQHSPVTVVRVEHTELALEADLASEILVMCD